MLGAVRAEMIKPNPVLRNKVGFLEIIVFKSSDLNNELELEAQRKREVGKVFQAQITTEVQ